MGKHCTFVMLEDQIKSRLQGNDRAIDTQADTLRQYSILRVYTPYNSSLLHGQQQSQLEPHQVFQKVQEQGISGLARREDCIQFIIKVYEDGLGSKFIEKFPLYEGIRLFGPFGVGLGITPTWLKSCKNPIVVAFSGGTAINIFLDLVYYMYCYTFPEFKSYLSHDFTFHIFAGFKTEEDAYGNELMFLLQQKNPQKFKVHLYFTRKQTDIEKKNGKRFDLAYLEQHLPKELDRIWLRGPLPFEKALKIAFEHLKIDKKKIIEL